MVQNIQNRSKNRSVYSDDTIENKQIKKRTTKKLPRRIGYFILRETIFQFNLNRIEKLFNRDCKLLEHSTPHSIAKSSSKESSLWCLSINALFRSLKSGVWTTNQLRGSTFLICLQQHNSKIVIIVGNDCTQRHYSLYT